MKHKMHSLTFSHVRTLYRPLEAREMIFLSVSLTSLDVFIKDDSPLMTSNAMWFPNRLPLCWMMYFYDDNIKDGRGEWVGLILQN